MPRPRDLARRERVPSPTRSRPAAPPATPVRIALTSTSFPEQLVRAPTPEETTGLATQLLAVNALTERHLGRSLSNDDTDLALLQEILDRGIVDPTKTHELQCLGIVFGGRLIDAVEGFDWYFVEDEYGVEPALRFAASRVLLFPLTMISKRVERGEHVHVRAMFDETIARVAEMAAIAERVH